MKTIKLNKYKLGIFTALENVRSKDTTRPSINVIMWDAEKKNVVSTNGKSFLYYNNEHLETWLGDENLYFTVQKDMIIEQESFKENKLRFPMYQNLFPDISKMNRTELKYRSDIKDNSLFYMSQISAITGRYLMPDLFKMTEKIARDLEYFSWSNDIDYIVLHNESESIKYMVCPMVRQK